MQPDVSPADFAFYAMIARRRAGGRDFVNWRTPDVAAEYLREYARVTADDWAPNTTRVRRRLRNGADAEWFEQRKARVNHVIRTTLGTWLAPAYEIASQAAGSIPVSASSWTPPASRSTTEHAARRYRRPHRAPPRRVGRSPPARLHRHRPVDARCSRRATTDARPAPSLTRDSATSLSLAPRTPTSA